MIKRKIFFPGKCFFFFTLVLLFGTFAYALTPEMPKKLAEATIPVTHKPSPDIEARKGVFIPSGRRNLRQQEQRLRRSKKPLLIHLRSQTML